jgi:hypothetical protein
MADYSNPGDSLALRASDADRERVADRLREAVAQGQISMDELDERLEATYAAKTFGELVPVTADLPAPTGTGTYALTPAGTPAPSRIGGTPGRRRWSIAIMGGSSRKGVWTVPPTYTSFAIMGGVELDLREATFAAPETVIHVFALMGGIDIKVPEGVEVHVDALGFMGGVDGGAAESSNPAGGSAPVVRIVGLAVMGGIGVSRKPLKRKKPKSDHELTDGDRRQIEQ